MKVLRFIPLAIGWIILGISVAIFCAATGLGWIGEQVMSLAFEGNDNA
jgi:hypothetical protein